MIEQRFSWQIEAILCERVQSSNAAFCIFMGKYNGKDSLAVRPFPKDNPTGVIDTLYFMDDFRKESEGKMFALFFDEGEEYQTVCSFHLLYDRVGGIREDKTEELCNLLLSCDEKQFSGYMEDAVPISVPFGYVIYMDEE